tara:strand:+ start:202 stop:384 length:183 start_codon:yes stop_codon:yes gene_type:complete
MKEKSFFKHNKAIWKFVGYSVWIGGTEINDYYMHKKQAEDLANQYIQDGYDDVKIEKYKL